MKNFLKLLIILTSFYNYAQGEIIETNSLEYFEKATEAANKETLVIFDVQEVLIVAQDQILGPLYKADRTIYKDKIIAKHTPAKQEKLFSIILKDYKTSILDSQLIKILETLKARGVRAIALTSGYTSLYGVIKSREDFKA